MTEERDYEYYKRLVQERGIVLRYPEDCGCQECQISYAWIEDGCPGQQESFDKIEKALEEL